MFLCDKCHRHVRETTCPFCGTDVNPATARGRTMHSGIKRSAVLVTALALGACGPGTGTPDADVISIADVYGIPGDSQIDAIVVEAGPDAAAEAGPDAAAEAGDDVISAGDVYGIPGDAPPVDVISEDASDVITFGDVYGIPGDAQIDARPDVSVGPAYGIPFDGG